MPSEMAELVEFICLPRHIIHNCLFQNIIMKKGLSIKAYNYALNNFNNCLGWRTDFDEFSKI